MENKAIHEREVLDQFISSYSEFPNGRIFKTESPDFILAVNPRYKIGIELTHLHNPAEKNNTSYSAIQLTKDILNAVILKKEEKIPIYEKKKLDELWLIITMIEPGQMPNYNLNNKLESWTFNNSFTKVFLFNFIDFKIYQIY
ncbi:MAG: hypothetical protein ISS19_03065 [Bacteroidales bacterium]|nr:hypothetical protein [Bacteroidales bacterium]